jgi:hypothetical protein
LEKECHGEPHGEERSGSEERFHGSFEKKGEGKRKEAENVTGRWVSNEFFSVRLANASAGESRDGNAVKDFTKQRRDIWETAHRRAFALRYESSMK